VQKIRNRCVDFPEVHPYNAIPLPEQMNIDDLAVMLDEDLASRWRFMEEDRRRAFSLHMDTRPWEEEIAYIKREQQIRSLHRSAHVAWVDQVEREFALAELGLPPGDFDNSVYVYAATNGRPRWN